jgi:hypothetical protein
MKTLFATLALLAGVVVSLGQQGSNQTSDAPPRTYQPPSSGAYIPQPPHYHTRPDPPIIILGPQPWFGPTASLGGPCGSGGTHDQAKALSEHGPQCPLLYSMSSLSVAGFVKGGWPMVLDYELREPGIYLVTVTVEGQNPFQYLLDGTRIGHQQQVFTLPDRLGSKIVVGNCTLSALSNIPGEVRSRYVRVFGWGCGPRAVGSVAIDQVRFTPPSLRPKEKQAALYGFHSHADFEKVTAEFERVGLVNGSIMVQLEDQQKINEPVRINTEISDKRWDPKKASVGQHLLKIRAWYSANRGGDWVIAWSPEVVRIEE